MAVYKKPLYDKDGNQIYPDVGLELDEVIYGDDPGQVETPSPWIETGDIKDNQITSAKIDWTTITPTAITPSDYLVFNSGITINDLSGYKIGKLVNIHYDIATTLEAGQNIVGTGTNKVLKATYGAGRVTNPGQGVASIVVIPSGDLRIYTSQYGTASAGDVWFFEA